MGLLRAKNPVASVPGPRNSGVGTNWSNQTVQSKDSGSHCRGDLSASPRGSHAWKKQGFQEVPVSSTEDLGVSSPGSEARAVIQSA